MTIPKEIRDRLGLEAGQEVEFLLGDDGTVRVRPKRPAMARLQAVKETIAEECGPIDVDAIRRESKRAWGSMVVGRDRDAER